MFDIVMAEAAAKSPAVSSVAAFHRKRYSGGSLPGEGWPNSADSPNWDLRGERI
jgi:hypothetical protein